MLLKHRKVIVTGGPTREWIDPVRFISNPSSGKMGAALAGAAARCSGETVFIHGPVDRSIISGLPCRTVSVESTSDMLNAVLRELVNNAVLIMAAAPADYTSPEKSAQKIKKTDDELVLRLKKTPDILRTVAANVSDGTFTGLFTAGFAAETTNIEQYALGKLKAKNLDMICLNDVSREGAGFGSDTNIITIYVNDGRKIDLPVMTKKEAADRIIEMIEGELRNA